MEAEAVRMDGSIVCHSTLNGDNAVCRGFFDRHKTFQLRMAIDCNAIKEVDVAE